MPSSTVPYLIPVRACPACLSVFATEPEFCAFDGERLVDAQALKGRVLGDFRFEELIGMGGTGGVFRGSHVKTGRPCAIKLVFGEVATEWAVQERFRREIQAVSALDHPNIVQILSHGRTPAGLMYMVMELAVGLTLKDLIEREGPLAPLRVGRFAEQLVSGLAEAHHKGFVHRDLKPCNIVVSRDDAGREQLKILDFGIVASLHQRMANPRMTKTGFIVGTPTYMAPEQVDAKLVSPQADVYALGIILYEMLTGAPPFDGSFEQVLVAKMTRPLPPLPQAGELGPLISSMVDAQPERRPANALQLNAALSRISLLSDDPKTVRADAWMLLEHNEPDTDSSACPHALSLTHGEQDTDAMEVMERSVATDISIKVRDESVNSAPVRPVSPAEGAAELDAADTTYMPPPPSTIDCVDTRRIVDPTPSEPAVLPVLPLSSSPIALPLRREQPVWITTVGVVLLLTLSALLGFFLANRRDVALVEVPVLQASPR